MKILFIHNRYQQPGGEDAVLGSEADILRSYAHEVVLYEQSNDEINDYSPIKKLSFLLDMDWSETTYNEVRNIIRKEKPDVAHFHNTFAVISPSGYYACKDESIPVIQTLHNYRLLCPAATFFRDRKICEECIKGSLLRSVQYGCYRNSRIVTAALARMLQVHRKKGTWENAVDVYIALTEFSRRKFIEAGFPGDKIVVKPNFVLDPGERSEAGDYAVFVGRLSPEKGVWTLLKAWEKMMDIPLKIIGDGPLAYDLKNYAENKSINVKFLGQRPFREVLNYMKCSAFMLMPSEWYEGFPRIIAEAYACGVPVVASRLGSMEELILEGKTGLLFKPGDASDLAEKAKHLWENEALVREMGKNARKEYEKRYAADKNYKMLMKIYRKAIDG